MRRLQGGGSPPPPVVDVLDTYSGHTDPGGPATRGPSALTITKVSVGPMGQQRLPLVCSETGEALLIDAANDRTALRAWSVREGAQLRTTVTTHRHYDHWQALGAVAEAGTRQLAHLGCARLVLAGTTRSSGRAITAADAAGGRPAGHTPGSIALAVSRG